MLRVTLTSVLVPLVILALGVWEIDRGDADRRDLDGQRSEIVKAVQRLEARPAPARGTDMGAQFRLRGQLYAGPLALQKAHEALDDVETAISVARVRRVLSPVTIGCAALTAALSFLVLAGAALLARIGRMSREALVRGFTLMRRALPLLLGAQVLLLAACAVTVVTFEALAILEVGEFSSGSVKLLGIAALVVGGSLWTAVKAVLQLRRTVSLFQPDPMPVLGRLVAAAEAPGLWQLLDDLAVRLDALRPDNVVIGLTGGFFVSSGPKLLQPGDVPLTGRTLYLPLPYLSLLRTDELSAIVGHELAHFSGSDTQYSLRFLPIYAGVERSLDAVAAAGTTSAGSVSLLTRPALGLGLFAMAQFHHAVQHWSRRREFEADAAGASATSGDAAARALLRVAAAERLVDRTLDAAFEAPDAAPPDLVAATLRDAADHGLDDPASRLEDGQPHPTDSHPPTSQRIAALGRTPDSVSLAEAMAPPSLDTTGSLSRLFAYPEALCRLATADLLNLARQRSRAVHLALEEAAAAVGPEERALYENIRGGCLVVIGMGAVFMLLGLALQVFGLPGLGLAETRVVAGIASFGGLGLLGYGVFVLRRGRTPFLLLRPDGMMLPGLDRPIAWEHVADLDMALDRGRISTRVLLPPEAPFPAHCPGGRRMKLDARRRIVTFTAGLPRGMKAQGFADLIRRYRLADSARRQLAIDAEAWPAALKE